MDDSRHGQKDLGIELVFKSRRKAVNVCLGNFGDAERESLG